MTEDVIAKVTQCSPLGSTCMQSFLQQSPRESETETRETDRDRETDREKQKQKVES